MALEVDQLGYNFVGISGDVTSLTAAGKRALDDAGWASRIERHPDHRRVERDRARARLRAGRAGYDVVAIGRNVRTRRRRRQVQRERGRIVTAVYDVAVPATKPAIVELGGQLLAGSTCWSTTRATSRSVRSRRERHALRAHSACT